MGDMKTPDFDDLLAAFDIPDIDAKEAIQSAPEEAEGHHAGPGGGSAKSAGGNGTGAGGALLRPPGSPDQHHHHPQLGAHSSQGDPSVVSVIVKNRVRLEAFGDPEADVDKDGLGGTAEGGGGVVMGPRMPGLMPSEPLIHNGFEAPAGSVDATLSEAQAQVNGELWAPCPSKGAGEGGASDASSGSASATKQGGGVFNRLKPGAQGPGDPVGKVRKILLLQQQQQLQMQQHEAVPEGASRAKAPGPADGPGVSVGMASPFFSTPVPLHASASAASLSHPGGPQLSHPSLSDVVSHPSGTGSPPLPPAQPFNGAQSGGFPHLELDEEDSEPDLGSPLVIQESPDSPVCSPPKFPRCHTSPPEPFGTSASRPSPSLPKALSSPPPPAGPQASQSWVPAPAPAPAPVPSVNSSHEEHKSEHVIEERDSPESPEPEAPYSGLCASSASAAPGRSSTSVFQQAGEGREMNGSKDREAEDTKASGTDGTEPAESLGEEGERVDEEKMEVEECEKLGTRACVRDKGPALTGATAAGSPAVTSGTSSRPLKVRIKTIKTSTGGITRTVTRVAPKGAGSAADRACDSSRALSGGHRLGNDRRKGSAPSSSRAGAVPVSTLQDASSAMLAAASKAQNKMASAEKTKVSATAVSITKATALPSVLPSSAAGVGSAGISVRPVVQKTLNGSSTASPASQASKPASIVNSTGAVISRSQSSLVEAFNKVLNSKNLLPSYRPELSNPLPSEWNLPLPASGYRCLECGDAFALERSLARHYDRRSLRIEVTCNHCAKRLAFFNKCSLLLHAREHKERGLVMQCSHLVMRPISMEQMIGQQDPMPIGMLSPSLSLPPSASLATALATAPPSSVKEEPPAPAAPPAPPRRAAGTSHVLLPLPCKKGDELEYHNFKCPECRAQCAGKAELVAHFQEVKAASNTTCTLCSPAMMLPNACSAAAHQRIHKHRSPHVCPECGGVARPATFQTHLDESCLHFSRRIGYKCSSCQVVFGGLNSIKSHIQTAHCEVFHKCPSCPMAFKSGPMAQAHISTQHPALGSAQAKMIYKCVMCDTVFTQKPLLYVHFDTHLAKQKVHVFKCPDCTKLYAQKGSMMEHIKVAHRGLSVKQEAPEPVSTPAARDPPSSSAPKSSTPVKTESSDGEDWAGEREEEEGAEDEDDGSSAPDTGLPGAPADASLEWSCRQCQTHYTERDAYVSHMRKEHGKSMKKFPCRMCERSFCSAPSLRRHVRVNHEGIRRVFHCQYCTEGKRTFSSRLILEKHMRLQHGLTDQEHDVRQSPVQTRKRADSGQPRSDGPDSSSELEATLGALGAGSGEEDEETGAGAGSEECSEGGGPAKRPRGVAPAPEEESVFRCVPCGFSTEDRQEFLQHIPQHRSDGSSQQCSQCGVCFTSGGSLSRHRFITHRVRDPAPHGEAARPAPWAQSPGTTGSGSADPALPSGSSSSPSSPAPPQLAEDSDGRVGCRVCGRRFDRASDLSTHFRTHGMAFLTAHKTDKPA